MSNEIERESMVRKLHEFLRNNHPILSADTSSGAPNILLEHYNLGLQVYVGRRVTGRSTQSLWEERSNPSPSY